MLVIRSVISEDLDPSMSGCNNSIPKLIKKQKSTVFKKFPFPNRVNGKRNPNGIGDNNAPAYTLQEQHCHAVFAVYPIRDPNLNKNANGFIVSEDGAPAPTLSATDRHAVAACYVNSSGNDIAGTLDASYYKCTGARSGI